MDRLIQQNYKILCRKVIQSALDDLAKNNNRKESASRFFQSRWFEVVAYLADFDHGSVLAEAKTLPGYVTHKQRRKTQAVASNAVKQQRRRKSHIRIFATDPSGNEYVFHSQTEAAKVIGCSPSAISQSIRDKRNCLGWKFLMFRTSKTTA